MFARPLSSSLDTRILKFLGLLAFFSLLIGCVTVGVATDNFFHYSQLASAFASGRLSLPHMTYDGVAYRGQFFLPFGPFPAIALVPVVLFFQIIGTSAAVPAFIFNLTIVFGCFFTAVSLATRLGYSRENSYWLAVAFCGASVFLPVVSLLYVWQVGQVVTVLFLLLALREYFGRARPWFIGLCFAAVLATRPTAGLGIVFFLFAMATTKNSERQKMRDCFLLLLPVFGAALFLGLYNFVRFGDVFEFGYSYQNLIYEPLIAARAYGLFSLAHLPGNLYYFFLAPPLPVFRDGVSHVLQAPYVVADPWGMSLFITSPYLVTLFYRSYKDRLLQALWVTVVIMALPIFFYYGVGWMQIGYRYALDFLPFLFVLFLMAPPRPDPLTWRMKSLIVASVLVNTFFIMTFRF